MFDHRQVSLGNLIDMHRGTALSFQQILLFKRKFTPTRFSGLEGSTGAREVPRKGDINEREEEIGEPHSGSVTDPIRLQ